MLVVFNWAMILHNSYIVTLKELSMESSLSESWYPQRQPPAE
jgi:hypothetical protein